MIWRIKIINVKIMKNVWPQYPEPNCAFYVWHNGGCDYLWMMWKNCSKESSLTSLNVPSRAKPCFLCLAISVSEELALMVVRTVLLSGIKSKMILMTMVIVVTILITWQPKSMHCIAMVVKKCHRVGQRLQGGGEFDHYFCTQPLQSQSPGRRVALFWSFVETLLHQWLSSLTVINLRLIIKIITFLLGN